MVSDKLVFYDCTNKECRMRYDPTQEMDFGAQGKKRMGIDLLKCIYCHSPLERHVEKLPKKTRLRGRTICH